MNRVPDTRTTSGTLILQELTGLKRNNEPPRRLAGPSAWSTRKVSEGKLGGPEGWRVRSAATKTLFGGPGGVEYAFGATSTKTRINAMPTDSSLEPTFCMTEILRIVSIYDLTVEGKCLSIKARSKTGGTFRSLARVEDRGLTTCAAHRGLCRALPA